MIGSTQKGKNISAALAKGLQTPRKTSTLVFTAFRLCKQAAILKLLPGLGFTIPVGILPPVQAGGYIEAGVKCLRRSQIDSTFRLCKQAAILKRSRDPAGHTAHGRLPPVQAGGYIEA